MSKISPSSSAAAPSLPLGSPSPLPSSPFPLPSPLTGGLVETAFGWRAIFYLITAAVLVIVIACPVPLWLLLVGFRRLIGYRDLPRLAESLERRREARAKLSTPLPDPASREGAAPPLRPTASTPSPPLPAKS